jgi:large subunit ribosomal protein L21
MYAIIETGGKQYAVAPGDRVRVEKLQGDVGAEINFDRVLLVGEGENVTVGTPVVSGAKVTGKILSHGRDKKVIVFKMRRRTNYRRKQGHRQHFTELEVTEVSA